MNGEGHSAEAITAASGSNLAFALRFLPQGRRGDMRVFYAFCRIVDDLADEPGLPREWRQAGLGAWRRALLDGASLEEPSLAPRVRELVRRYEIPVEWLLEIIRGCEMDLEGRRYESWPQLRQYCYCVASAVGLVSARVFGGEGCERFAEELGIALQLTNILRDLAEDYRILGRGYIPKDELERFGILEGSWVFGRPAGWEEFVQFQIDRARGFYAAACEALPVSQRRVMAAAEIMREIYSWLLGDMAADGLRVWARTYRVGRFRKLWLASKVFGATLAKSALSELRFF